MQRADLVWTFGLVKVIKGGEPICRAMYLAIGYKEPVQSREPDLEAAQTGDRVCAGHD